MEETKEIVERLVATAGAFNAALADAKSAGLRVNFAALMNKHNDGCDALEIREIAHTLYPQPSKRIPFSGNPGEWKTD